MRINQLLLYVFKRNDHQRVDLGGLTIDSVHTLKFRNATDSEPNSLSTHICCIPSSAAAERSSLDILLYMGIYTLKCVFGVLGLVV